MQLGLQWTPLLTGNKSDRVRGSLLPRKQVFSIIGGYGE